MSPVRGPLALDPALTASPSGIGASLWYGTCGTLMAFRDGPAPNGFKVRPEAAAGQPRISADRKTYVFLVRKGLRFSNGRPLRAVNFARALQRVRNPAMHAIGAAALFSDVKRVSARGRRLRIELWRPGGDLPMRLALPYACPVPSDFPINPAGETLMAGSGPYRIASYEAGRLVVARNGNYRGRRPQRIDSLVVTFGGRPNDDLNAVEQGRAEVYAGDIPFDVRDRLADRYGINERQLWRERGTVPYTVVFNTSRRLFRNNAPLRRAINLALDRREIVRRGEGWPRSHQPTDQIVPSWIPGRVDHRLYSLTGPRLTRARRLANGNLRGGEAVLYVADFPFLLDQAQIIVSNLRAIGLDLTVRPIAPPVLEARAGTRGEPFDLLLTRFQIDYPDPANLLIRLLGGRNAREPSGNTNYAYFDRPRYDRKMAAANRLTGRARARAFAKLEAEIMSKEAPWAPLYEGSAWLFLSRRVGCFKHHPVFRLDWPAVCVR